jgi:hypothetical protein
MRTRSEERFNPSLSGTGRPPGKEEPNDAYNVREVGDDAARRCGSVTEREGFEPSRQVNPAHAISSRAP